MWAANGKTFSAANLLLRTAWHHKKLTMLQVHYILYHHDATVYYYPQSTSAGHIEGSSQHPVRLLQSPYTKRYAMKYYQDAQSPLGLNLSVWSLHWFMGPVWDLNLAVWVLVWSLNQFRLSDVLAKTKGQRGLEANLQSLGEVGKAFWDRWRGKGNIMSAIRENITCESLDFKTTCHLFWHTCYSKSL